MRMHMHIYAEVYSAFGINTGINKIMYAPYRTYVCVCVSVCVCVCVCERERERERERESVYWCRRISSIWH